MAYVPRRKIGWLAGVPQTNAVPVAVYSFAATNITIELFANNSFTPLLFTATVTPTKICDDRGSADPRGETWSCYRAFNTFTGLTAGTRYFVRLTQGAVTEGTTAGDYITFWTAPVAGTDFRCYFVGCDKLQFENNGGGITHYEGGFYTAVKVWMDANGTTPTYINFADDFGYPDGWSYWAPIWDDGYTDKQASGNPSGSIETSTAATYKTYDYGMTYLAMLGMLGPDTAIASALDYTYGVSSVNAGREAGRAWVLRNATFALQWGDHEFINNIADKSVYTGTAQETPYYLPGRNAWEAFFGGLQTAVLAGVADTYARPIAYSLGDLRVVAADHVTNGDGRFPVGIDYDNVTEFDAMLGMDQITDILNAMDTSHSFKLLVHQQGDRTWYAESSADRQNEDGWGNTTSLFDHCQSEWNRLYLSKGDTPPSLMDNDKTNGTTGVSAMVYGDQHVQIVAHMHGSYGPSVHQENWLHWYHGSLNAMKHVWANATMLANIATPNFRGMTRWVSDYKEQAAVGLGAGLAVDISGTASPKTMRLTLLKHDSSVFASHLYKVGSNLPVQSHKVVAQSRPLLIRGRFADQT